MEFKERQTIYMQIAEYFYENILSEKWLADEKIPSVRQMAIDLEVNPNTVMRSYSYLQDEGIIVNQRGIGYFVAPKAKEIVYGIKKNSFINHDLPIIFKTMESLDIDCKEIDRLYGVWKINK